ncbi:hypothetical protein P7K49_016411 [Saguinus oedipus]|uniref:Autophagy-related protein n=1 Tax=Saguinus oedipus TaxID=9490 RepID=A0ABQ9VEW0_SAGOE|nr:hypothetical protein P7K49_016411 [Saguinus oedipus]
MKWMFKEDHSLEHRCVESAKIRAKYPDQVPVIVEKVSGSQIVDIDKQKISNYLSFILLREEIYIFFTMSLISISMYFKSFQNKALGTPRFNYVLGLGPLLQES